MIIIPAEEIIDKIEFNNYSDWETYPEAEFKCTCGQIVTINFRNLNKHSSSSFSNLNEIDIKKIEETVNTSLHFNPQSFLDFYCPKCKKPVRIYYESWAGGHHGEAGHVLKHIVM